jgi:hypothetical protein
MKRSHFPFEPLFLFALFLGLIQAAPSAPVMSSEVKQAHLHTLDPSLITLTGGDSGESDFSDASKNSN